MERLGMNQIIENSSNLSLHEQCDYEIAHGTPIEEVKEKLEMHLLSTTCQILQENQFDDHQMMERVQEEIQRYDECKNYLNTLNLQKCQKHR